MGRGPMASLAAEPKRRRMTRATLYNLDFQALPAPAKLAFN
ncbi:MAG: hypothetical protein ACK4MF_12285 [Hyphomicrobiaceae bacterium]